MVAQCSAPAAEPRKGASFRLSAMGLIDRSTVLESISMRPSSMNPVNPSQFGPKLFLAEAPEERATTTNEH